MLHVPRLAPPGLRAAACLLVIGLAALVAGCSRQDDTFDPQIVVVSPGDNAVTQRKELVVSGYVMDDQGVKNVFVKAGNGTTDLLSTPAFSRQRGQKLVRFAFTAQSRSAGSLVYELRAVDVNGRSGRRELSLVVDTVSPNFADVLVVAQGETLTVTGKATDNVKVANVYVNQAPVPISSGRSVDFYAQVPRTGQVALAVKDGAGNRYDLLCWAPYRGSSLPCGAQTVP